MSFYACRVAATAANRLLLGTLDQQGRIAFDHVHDDGHWLRFALNARELKVLREHDIAVEIVEDLAKTAPGKLEARATPRRAARRVARRSGDDDDGDDALSTGFVDRYLDADEVASRIAALAAEFPALCHLGVLPEASHGYDGAVPALAGPSDVQLLRLTNDPADRSRPALLLVCGTHAREWINPLIAIEFAEQLVRNHDPASLDPDAIAITRILQQGEVLIVPVMNPDGLNYSIHDDPGWRKNRRANAGAPGCPGVDNNRNYDMFFGGGGSSGAPCDSTHRGPSAFSEPENRNIRHIAETYPNILIAVDSHSAGEDLFRPTATGGSFIGSLPVSPEDELIYQQLEDAANAAIQSVSGKTYTTGSTSNHAGTSDEYLFFAHRVFAFDCECALEFQPPIDSALVSVQEVVAALRALAIKAVDLEVDTAAPVRIVQAIDRTGSMAAFGYDDDARANAKRFVDLMSLGDSTAVVSFADPSPDPAATPFADRASVDFPLTALTLPTMNAARDGVDALAFGGWTSLGAGLRAAADLLAPTTAGRDAIVLLSDGFENREPWTAAVLAGFPAGIAVHAIALGPQSDVPLLQQIADQTGGAFHLSPTSLDLYAIYNQIRADATDDDLVFNGEVDTQGDDGGVHFLVEDGVSRLLVSLAGLPARKSPRVALIDAHGRRLRQGMGISARCPPRASGAARAAPMPGTLAGLHRRTGDVPCRGFRAFAAETAGAAGTVPGRQEGPGRPCGRGAFALRRRAAARRQRRAAYRSGLARAGGAEVAGMAGRRGRAAAPARRPAPGTSARCERRWCGGTVRTRVRRRARTRAALPAGRKIPRRAGDRDRACAGVRGIARAGYLHRRPEDRRRDRRAFPFRTHCASQRGDYWVGKNIPGKSGSFKEEPFKVADNTMYSFEGARARSLPPSGEGGA